MVRSQVKTWLNEGADDGGGENERNPTNNADSNVTDFLYVLRSKLTEELSYLITKLVAAGGIFHVVPFPSLFSTIIIHPIMKKVKLRVS